MSKVQLRNLWFQVHKWIGVALALLIIPIALSGAALVWHDWLDASVNPERSVKAETALPPSDFAEAARRALAPGERIMSIAYDGDAGPVLVTAARPPVPGETRPVRTLLWLHPGDGRVVDRGSNDEGLVRVLHVLHGRLMMGTTGRQIVGWVGVGMLISSLTGLWLWWPLSGSWSRGLRWRRQPTTNANLHHLAGFWIALPLAMLSFTGVWISFPSFFGPISGVPAPKAAPPSDPPQPLVETKLTPDAAHQAALPYATGSVTSIAWPTDAASEWKVSFNRPEGGTAEVKVVDGDGTATPPPTPTPEAIARTMRRWHDGTGMGPVWQIIIFIGGILPALLAVTGVIMWLRSRGWRGDAARKRRVEQDI